MKEVSKEVAKRQMIEKRIARRFILDAIHAGYWLNVYNGGDTNELPKPSNKAKEVLAAMFATDEETLLVYRKATVENEGRTPKPGLIRFGWVHLVYGNDGYDVIGDYTCNLDDLGLMKGANELSDKYQ
jgi:hypothetical protein